MLTDYFSFTASIKVVGISATPDDEIGETGKDTEQTNVSLKTSNFYTEAIKSIDPAIRENEDNQDYIKNFLILVLQLYHMIYL